MRPRFAHRLPPVLILSVLAGIPGVRAGEEASDDTVTRSFHVGNSLTDTVDGWLARVAKDAGRPLDFHRFTIPGAPTDWLWSHPGSGFGDSRYGEAFATLAPIDHIVTQPFAGHGRSLENEAEHTGTFYELCRRHSPDVQLWLYQQWPNRAFDEGWSRGILALGPDRSVWEQRVALQPGEAIADGGWQGTVLKKAAAPATWQEAARNHSRYFELLRIELERRFPGRPIRIIPGGLALAALKDAVEAGRVPGMQEFFPEIFADDIHLGPKGRYLIALVHLACFFREDPEREVGVGASGLSEDQARIFRHIAWETVKKHPWTGAGK